VQTSL